MDRNNPDHIAEIADPARGNGFPVWASGQLSRAIIAYYEATQDPRALRALEIATNDRRFANTGISENLPGYGVDAYRLGGSAAVAANGSRLKARRVLRRSRAAGRQPGRQSSSTSRWMSS